MIDIGAILGLANELKEMECTLNIISNGKLILRMGERAKPGLLSPLGPIEIKDLKTLLKFLEE
jgi:hypothetical protein